jgi:MYND finger
MTDTAHCARCGRPMPAPVGRAARKRYCSTACRKAAWRDRHRDDASDDVSEDVLTHVVPNAVPGVVAATPSRDAVATPGSQHRCPHCRQPLAIISVVIPADAAVVSVPEPPMTPR